ncbi:MAG: hypothetical protein ISP90_06070 [Nevskia sp.]|nr:hypothetical protein [Nevskia sp.]
MELNCPYCTNPVKVDEALLADGAAVRCEHCLEEPLLSREWIEHEGGYRWELVGAAEDDDEA